MKKKDEKVIEKEKIKKILIDAIEKKAETLKEYRETPTRTHLQKVVDELELSDNSAVLVLSYNPDTQNLSMKGVKAKSSDMFTMLQYGLAKLSSFDISSVLDCISTLARQEELNNCWVEHNETATELQEDGNDK